MFLHQCPPGPACWRAQWICWPKHDHQHHTACGINVIHGGGRGYKHVAHAVYAGSKLTESESESAEGVWSNFGFSWADSPKSVSVCISNQCYSIDSMEHGTVEWWNERFMTLYQFLLVAVPIGHAHLILVTGELSVSTSLQRVSCAMDPQIGIQPSTSATGDSIVT